MILAHASPKSESNRPRATPIQRLNNAFVALEEDEVELETGESEVGENEEEKSELDMVEIELREKEEGKGGVGGGEK